MNWGAKLPAIFWCFCPVSVKSAKRRKRCANTIHLRRKFCRCMRGFPTRNSTEFSSHTGGGASCWQLTWRKPRSLFPALNTWWIAAMRGFRAIPGGQECNVYRLKKSRKPRQISVPGGAGGLVTASQSAFTARTITTNGRCLLSQKFCAPTWRQSFCNWRRCGWRMSKISPSSSRPILVWCATVTSCCTNWARWMTITMSPRLVINSPNCRLTRVTGGCCWRHTITARYAKC